MTVLAPGGGAPAPPGRPAAVAGDQITCTFGSHTAVDQVDLRIEPGETFGLFGPNGAGKTTTIRMLVTLQRDRLMGIGQAITMPLLFSSSALYPVQVMPGWLRVITRFNPLSYEVDALRNLLIGIPTNLGLDLGVLIGVTIAGIAAAAMLLPRLAKG